MGKLEIIHNGKARAGLTGDVAIPGTSAIVPE